MVQGFPNSSKTVMVVDDDESVNSFLVFSLKQEGFKVVSMRDAEDALKYLKGSVPDLILLDVMLPNMDGLTMCQTLRKSDRFSKTPVLFITAYAEQNHLNVKKTEDYGAQGFIEKPIMFDELLLQIMDALSGKFSIPTRYKYAA